MGLHAQRVARHGAYRGLGVQLLLAWRVQAYVKVLGRTGCDARYGMCGSYLCLPYYVFLFVFVSCLCGICLVIRLPPVVYMEPYMV